MKIFEKLKVLDEVLAESEEDCPVHASLEVFFDEDRALNILLEHNDYDEPEYCYYSCAVVDNENCLKMASARNVSLTGLPRLLRNKFGMELCTGRASRAKELFYDVLDYIDNSGAKYVLNEEIPYS